MDEVDILKYASQNGIIDLARIQKIVSMSKRIEVLKKHPYKITQGKDGYWRTYIPDKESGRRMIKKINKEDLEDVVISYLDAAENDPTIQEVFSEWNDRRLELRQIVAATHTRNIEYFDRHYTEMGKRTIKSVSPDEFADFLECQIGKYNLSSKAFSNLKSITKGFLKRAKKRGLIEYNVESLFQELDVSDAQFRKKIKCDEDDVYTEEELPIMLQYLIQHQDSINLGILLMFLTGIRVGEMVALKHSDFDGNICKIQRTETRYSPEKGSEVYVVKDFPKTAAGIRTVIIPDSYDWVAKKIRALNPFGEYIFVSRTGHRISTPAVRKRVYKICDALGIKRKSPHKIRKTYGSILLDNSIDKKLITDLMGHTDIVCTETYYHKNRRSLIRKSEILSDIPEFSMKALQIR